MAESYGHKLSRFMSGDRKGLHPSEDPDFRDQLVADARRAIDEFIKIAPPAPGRGEFASAEIDLLVPSVAGPAARALPATPARGSGWRLEARFGLP